MNKNAIQKYAIWARNELIEQVKQRAYQYGINDKGYGDENAAVIAGRVLSADEKLQRHEFVTEIKAHGYLQTVEEVAYTWFNRFVALRFMEVNDYLPTHVRVFSDACGGFNPEILKDVLHLDLEGLDMGKVSILLNANQTEELYRYLLLTQCNALNSALPEMFERLGSYTEMLLPNNILKPEGVLGRLVTEIPEEDFRDAVQIIGWMYQYYNTEPKQAVFDGLKNNVKISKEKIPAATQLFTPDWIVRYMVENSLGRLWLESHPNAALKSNWKYYLDEAEQTPEVAERLRFLRSQSPVKSPEDICLIDPCMGSGHILVYAFDVLMQIYESVGVSPRDAAKLILEKNIYGLDIDRRAYQLAYFSIMMKARQYNRRILNEGIEPNVYSIQESNGINRGCLRYFGEGMSELERNTAMLQMNNIIDTLIDAKEYGSIITVEAFDWNLLQRFVGGFKIDWQVTFDAMEIDETHEQLQKLLDVAILLAQKYDVVVTNPPYMGSSGMSAKMSDYVKKNYPDSKSDLSTVFMEQTLYLCKPTGFMAMINIPVWMNLSSCQNLRKSIIINNTVVNMVHCGRGIFGSDFGTTTFVFSKLHHDSYIAVYKRLFKKQGAVDSLEQKETWFFEKDNEYLVSQDNYLVMPGNIFSYSAPSLIYDLFSQDNNIGNFGAAKQGLITGDNDRFLRYWFEIERHHLETECANRAETEDNGIRWYPYNKGGDYRKWFGNNWYAVDWFRDGHDIQHFTDGNGKLRSRPQNMTYYFQQGLTWTALTAGLFSMRYSPRGFLFDAMGPICFLNEKKHENYVLGLLNSIVGSYLLRMLCPNLKFDQKPLESVPCVIENADKVGATVDANISLSRADWDAFETSWDFSRHPLICGEKKVVAAFARWEREATGRFDTLKANEEELNHIFIAIYGLQEELTPEVEDKDVTVRRANLGREIRSLISYAVGCMFGRYSLDTEGLAYAGGDWDTSQHRKFSPDKDNILPICDDEYFDDDIVGRFVEFIKTVYGTETLEENLRYIADALGGRGAPREVIRNYFLNDFYSDHCKVYQKRPIYWLFDSGKKNGFKALIYLHRYSRDLLAKLRTDYVHEQQERYRTQLSHITAALNTAAGAERARLLKQQDKLTEQLKEIAAFEEKVHHLADQSIAIDLDDGVKKNYEIFADVLATI